MWNVDTMYTYISKHNSKDILCFRFLFELSLLTAHSLNHTVLYDIIDKGTELEAMLSELMLQLYALCKHIEK